MTEFLNMMMEYTKMRQEREPIRNHVKFSISLPPRVHRKGRPAPFRYMKIRYEKDKKMMWKNRDILTYEGLPIRSNPTLGGII